jgi:hypothetical protein
MKDKNEIDIRGSINTAVSETAKDLLGMLVVAIIFGFAFAPWFSPFFRNYLEHKYRVKEDIVPRTKLVNAEMKKIDRNLWIVAIISWVLILWAYVAYNY